ncbi:hypothetical protein B0O99DRAFT_682227 [Bisporella sp. PMI_857]|nr:hypothetical protein B0O99DRAFT_682763 [Bisporella sp. PMI_857]KAH8600537.1 hypothetical protein B0O99DRAFT_682227 [Bisporella sp. PMI_857]
MSVPRRISTTNGRPPSTGDEVDFRALFGGGTGIEESVFEADGTIVGNKVNEEVNFESTEIVPSFGTDEGDDLFQELFLGDKNTSKSGEEDRSELIQNGPADEPKEDMADDLFGDLAKDESPSSELAHSQSMKISCDIEKRDFINNSPGRLAPLTQLTPVQQLPAQHSPKRTAETARLPQAKARPAPPRPTPPRPTPACPAPQVRCQNPSQMGDLYLLRLSAHYEEYAHNPVNYLDPRFAQYQGSTQPQHNFWPNHVPQYVAQPNFNAQFGHYPHQAPQPQLPHSTQQASQAQYVPYSQPVPQSPAPASLSASSTAPIPAQRSASSSATISTIQPASSRAVWLLPQQQMIAQFDGQHDAYATAPVHVNQPLFIRQDQLPGYPAQHAPPQSQQHQARGPAPTGQGGHGNNSGGGNGDEGPFIVNPFAFDDQYF